MEAKRSLGQHFLVSGEFVSRIVEACRFAAKEAQGIVEVGPGRGALTSGLVALGKPFWAVEKDDGLAREMAARYPATRVTAADARSFDWCSLSYISGLHPWLLVGNLPYNTGTEIFHGALFRREVLCGAVVMLQVEVAQKFCGETGGAGYGPLAAWSDPWWERKLLFTVPPGAFRPVPKVTSAVCHFRMRREIPLPTAVMPDFWAFVRSAFRQPRKTLLANLVAAGGDRLTWESRLAGAGLISAARPAEVSPSAYIDVFQAASSFPSGNA